MIRTAYLVTLETTIAKAEQLNAACEKIRMQGTEESYTGAVKTGSLLRMLDYGWQKPNLGVSCRKSYYVKRQNMKT